MFQVRVLGGRCVVCRGVSGRRARAARRAGLGPGAISDRRPGARLWSSGPGPRVGGSQELKGAVCPKGKGGGRRSTARPRPFTR